MEYGSRKIKKAITKYIEKSFDCNDASISINFQKTKVYTRRSVKNIPFDPLNGDLLNPVYDINVRFSNDYDVYYYLTLLYDKKIVFCWVLILFWNELFIWVVQSKTKINTTKITTLYIVVSFTFILPLFKRKTLPISQQGSRTALSGV